MLLFIIIPCLNEEATIKNIIEKIPSRFSGIDEVKVLVVDDGSTDNTPLIAKESGAIVLSHKKNQGVGVAFHSGVERAIRMGADIVVNMDGDGQFNPDDIQVLINPIIKGKADCVTASRFMKKEYIPQMPEIKKWGNIKMASLISFLTGKKYHDVSCGFRAYSIETLLKLNLFGKFTYTQETFLDLAFKGIEILEVPLKIRGEREHGKSRVVKSIFNYAVNTAKIILRSSRDYKPLKFFSFFASIFFVLSFIFGSFFFYHYATTGMFSGHLWAGFSSGFLLLFSFLFFLSGLIGDMLVRIRNNQEKLLYYEKLKVFGTMEPLDKL